MNRSLRTFFLLFLGLILVSGFMLAQSRESGVIQGTVLDDEGSPLPGVSVSANSPSLMGTRSVVTDEYGKYRFPALPGGTYVIEAILEGFNPLQKTNVVLHTGMTVTVDFSLGAAKLEEEVTVVGETPLIDVTESSLAKTFITKDILQNIPTSQNAADIISLAPGVVAYEFGAGYSFAYGGSYVSNSYQLDGVELVDSWAGGGVYTAPIDYNVIEESQVFGLGAPAEYGGFTGAVVNVITKSGGNTLSGDLQFLYQGTSWQSKNGNIDVNNPYWSRLPEAPTMRLIDPSIRVGGPFIKDKLWFFGGFEYYSERNEMLSIDRSRRLSFPKVFLKLTFEPDPKNRFRVFFEHHNRTVYDNQLDLRFTNEANQDLLYPVYVGNFSFLHMFSPSTIFEVKVAGYKMTWDSIPSSRDSNTAGHYDFYTGEFSRNLYFWSNWKSSRFGLTTSLSHSVENFIGGSHEFKAGAEFERSPGGGSYDYNGPDGVVYYDWNGAPYMAEKMTYKQWAVNVRYSFYAQDSWKITDSFVLNPGIRFNIFRGSVPDLPQADKTVYKPTGLEPRFGFVWDLFKSHKTVLKAHIGKYYEHTMTYNFAQMTPMSDIIEYAVGPDWSSLTELYRIPGVDLYTADPNIKHPSAYQFVIGVEQILGRDFSANVSFIYKDWNNLLDPVNTGGIYAPISYTDPDTGKVYTIYNELNPGADHYLITNPEKGKDIGAAWPDIVSFTPDRKYRALELSLVKRFSDNWQFSASYVYSHEEGSYSNMNIPGMELLFQDPNNQINNKGVSPYYIPHIFKIQATYVFPMDFSMSLYYNYHSGPTWERILTIGGLNQGAVDVLAEPRGSRRLPATNNLDLRLEKSFYRDNFRFSFMLDIFNVFNEGKETGVFDYAGPDFGKPTDVKAPRSFRAGVRFWF